MQAVTVMGRQAVGGLWLEGVCACGREAQAGQPGPELVHEAR